MPNDDMETSLVNDVAKVENTSESANDYSLDQLLRLIRLARTQSLNNQYKNALNKLQIGQLRVSALTDLRRYINLSKDKDGNFDASNPEFQDLIQKAKKKYDQLSDELTKSGESPESMGSFIDFLEEVGIQEGKTSYNAEETKVLLDSIKMTTDQLSPLNEMYMQTVSRIESEISETFQMLMTAYKPMHNAITMMARGIKGS